MALSKLLWAESSDRGVKIIKQVPFNIEFAW